MYLKQYMSTIVDQLPKDLKPDFTKERIYYMSLEAVEYTIFKMVSEKNRLVSSLYLRTNDPNNIIYTHVKLNTFGKEYGLPFHIFKGAHNIYNQTDDGKSTSKFSITRTVVEILDLYEYGFEVDELKVCKHSTDKKGNAVYVIYVD